MLGRWGKSKYKSKDDFKTYKEYLEYMYGNTKGYIARMVLMPDEEHSQKLYKTNKLINENEYEGLPDVYTSMNSFLTGKSRKIKNLNRLNALFIDIDCYNLNLTPNQVIWFLENDFFDTIIPCPTFIINSGRGLYLIWKIYKGDDKNALPRWNKVQRYLHSKLKNFGADQQATDAARILRVPYTVNSKNKTTVEIAEFNDVQYTLYEIIKEYDIRGGENFNQSWGEATERQKECAAAIAREQDIELPDFMNYDATFKFISNFAQCRFKNDKKATDKQIKYATKIAVSKGLELPDFKDYQVTWDFIAKNKNKSFNKNINTEQVQSQQIRFEQAQSYLINWSEDIAKLITSRTGENCKRELCLFLYRLWHCESTHDYEDALQKTLELNAELNKPFSESYVRSHTYSAEVIIKRGDTYKYKKTRIVEMLKITGEEMKQLNLTSFTTISAKEREQIRNRQAYEKRLQEAGKKTEKVIIRTRQENMAILINNGKTKQEICAELNISPSTYYTDRAVLIADGLIVLVKKAIRSVKNEANKITESITNLIKEAAENFSKICEDYKKNPNSEHDITENGQKNQKCKLKKKNSRIFTLTIVYGLPSSPALADP